MKTMPSAIKHVTGVQARETCNRWQARENTQPVNCQARENLHAMLPLRLVSLQPARLINKQHVCVSWLDDLTSVVQ